MLVENMVDVNKFSVFDSSVYFQDMDLDMLIVCRKNYLIKYCMLFIVVSRNGYISVVQLFLNGRVWVDKMDGYEIFLLVVCRCGYV